MGKWIHERKDWTAFIWRSDAFLLRLGEVYDARARLFCSLESVGAKLRKEAILATLTSDTVKSSEIEGERLNENEVRSSIARRLGIKTAGLTDASRHIEGVVEMMLDATQRYGDALDEARLFGWHAALFPTGFSGLYRIETARYRTTPVAVVSGAIGKEKLHYSAPEAGKVPGEMATFLSWFNADNVPDPILKAAIAHIWFVLIHPFADGNGRIARAITDMLLARSDGSSERYYSMSTAINKHRKAYYDAIAQASTGDGDLTEWIVWFFGCLHDAIVSSGNLLADVFAKAGYWNKAVAAGLNERQRKMLAKLWDGFRGDLTTPKWAKMMKVSDDTALRDINDLLAKGLLKKSAEGGKSTKYTLPHV
jgi:Fic family protein